MQEFKYKFLIILEKDLLPIKSANYQQLEKYMYSNHPKFDKKFIESLFSNIQDKLELDDDVEEINTKENVTSSAKKEKPKKEKSETTKIFDNKREDNLKMKNTIIMEEFFKNSENLLELASENTLKSSSKNVLSLSKYISIISSKPNNSQNCSTIPVKIGYECVDS